MAYEWNRTIQEMVDMIDVNISCLCDDSLTLETLSRKLGYSEFHTTRQFRKHTGMRFRDYVRLRKLAYAAIELRDTRFGISNISARYGFGSQAAFTRAFKGAYGITPAAYRREGRPLALQTKHITFDPYVLGLGESSMNKQELQKVRVYSQKVPGHLFLHIKNYESKGYFDFWQRQEGVPGQDCKTICGLLDSIKGKLDGSDADIGSFSGQIMGFLLEEDGRRAEAYGVRLPLGWTGPKPEQMLVKEVKEGEYMVFEHPAFDYERIGATVCKAVEETAQGFDFGQSEFTLDERGRVGYFYFEPNRYLKIMRPVKRR